ncbi:MAG: hypothetical protein MJZ07_03060 [Bacteroidales bacterium]|nr:hypothetical protein [Bacteroidales bacterium]
MAKVKNARCGEYMISQSAEGTIKVAKDYENDKAALREIAEKIGFEADPAWTTRQFGRKLIETINDDAAKTKEYAYAESGEYVIFQTEEGSIQVYRDYDNVKGALREISEKIGFEYDPSWTTRQFGSKLIDELNK